MGKRSVCAHRSWAVVGWLFLCAGSVGCASTELTPDALHALGAEDPEAVTALVRWKRGIDSANDFLASDFSQTLPAGRFQLAGDGMRFVTEDAVYPIGVHVLPMSIPFGPDAQERSWGFVIGRKGDGDPLYANSMFRDDGCDWMHTIHVGGLVLHETAHVVFDVGTVGFWKGVAYYLEQIFLLRYRTHSAERLPFAVTDEYYAWVSETREF